MLYALLQFRDAKVKRTYRDALRARLYAAGYSVREADVELKQLADKHPYVVGREGAERAADVANEVAGVSYRLVES